MKKVIAVFLLGFLMSGVCYSQSVLMTTSNYESGNSAIYDIKSGIITDNLLSVYQDSYVKTYGDKIFIIEAGNQSNIIKLDSANPSKPVYQFSVGAGSNPHDMVFFKSSEYLKGYVLRYDKPSIAVVNLDATAEKDFIKGEIDISQWADEDGSPEAHMGFFYNGYIYVILQRYNLVKFQSETGYIIKIDPETDKIVDLDPSTEGVNGIVLLNKNPSKGSLVGSVLYLGGTTYGVEDIGVSSIDLSDLQNSQKRLTTETVNTESLNYLGGTFAGLYVFSADYGVVCVYDSNWNAVPYNYNPTQGKVGDKLPVSSAGGGAVMSNGLVYVGSSSFTAPGLYIVDPSTNKVIGEPKGTSLPVYSLAVLNGGIDTAVDEQPVSVFSLNAVSPNPFNSRTSISFNLIKVSNIRINVFNIAGQKVAELAESRLAPGKHTFMWDAGSLSSGIYIISVSDGILSKAVKASYIK
jgi:hypothetical protein